MQRFAEKSAVSKFVSDPLSTYLRTFPVRLRKVGSLLISITLSTAALASVSDAPNGVPGIKLMQHQKMAMDGQVIYEADVNLADTTRKQFGLEIGIDDRKWQYLTTEGSAEAVQDGTTDGHGNLANGWILSYVVTDVTEAGAARAELVYTLRDPAKGINKTEHVHADLKIGDRFTTTTPSGTKVWLIVSRQPR